jgi:hypothetical protein
MSETIDIQLIRENYQKMTNAELARIATQDAAGLTTEARQVVKVEIEKRGFDINIYNGVKAQNRKYPIEELDQYCQIVRDLNCPFCGSSDSKLNGTLAVEVYSFLVLTKYKRKLKVGCPRCLDKANNEALVISAVLGWWGIPWGIIKTFQAIGQNVKSKRSNHSESPNNYLRSFILAKIGQFETYKDNREELQQLVKTY